MSTFSAARLNTRHTKKKNKVETWNFIISVSNAALLLNNAKRKKDSHSRNLCIIKQSFLLSNFLYDTLLKQRPLCRLKISDSPTSACVKSNRRTYFLFSLFYSKNKIFLYAISRPFEKLLWKKCYFWASAFKLGQNLKNLLRLFCCCFMANNGFVANQAQPKQIFIGSEYYKHDFPAI